MFHCAVDSKAYDLRVAGLRLKPLAEMFTVGLGCLSILVTMRTVLCQAT